MSIRQRDLLPLPKPFPEAGQLVTARVPPRGMQRMLHSEGGWKLWANDGVATINALGGASRFCRLAPTQAQSSALDRIRDTYSRMGAQPEDMSPAGAFKDLCQNALPYLSEAGGPASFEKGNV